MKNMGMVFVACAAICILASIIFFAAGRSINNKDRRFLSVFQKTSAKILGYRQIDSGDDKPIVSIIVQGTETRVEAKSAEGINPQTYPAGSTIAVGYAPVTVMGVNTYDVRILDSGGNVRLSGGSARVLSVISVLLLTAGLVFVTIGLIDIFKNT